MTISANFPEQSNSSHLKKRSKSAKNTTYHRDKFYGYEEREDVMFGSDKIFLGNRSCRVASSQAAEAKIFAFLESHA